MSLVETPSQTGVPIDFATIRIPMVENCDVAPSRASMKSGREEPIHLFVFGDVDR